MQDSIREAPVAAMPAVGNFQAMKDNVGVSSADAVLTARPPPQRSAWDSPENVAYFAEYLLVGTTDEEFANKDDPNEYDIRNAEL